MCRFYFYLLNFFLHLDTEVDVCASAFHKAKGTLHDISVKFYRVSLYLFFLDFLLAPVCKEEVSPEEEWSSSLVQEESKSPKYERIPSVVQEEPQLPQIKEEQEELFQRPEQAGGSTLTLLAVKSEDDDENSGTEPLANRSTEHMKTQADVEDWEKSQPTSDDQLLSSHCSEVELESDSEVTEDSDDWEETSRG